LNSVIRKILHFLTYLHPFGDFPKILNNCILANNKLKERKSEKSSNSRSNAITGQGSICKHILDLISKLTLVNPSSSVGGLTMEDIKNIYR